MMERLQKVIAASGIASRRRAEELIRAGRVKVNGVRVSELGTRVDPERDRVLVDGQPVGARPKEILMLHKPEGFVSTRRDRHAPRTVMELLPPWARSLYPVGRLDQYSSGLLLLTNDGELAHRLMHPSFEVERAYEVETSRPIDDASLARLAREHAVRRTGPSTFQIVLHEGKKREIRDLVRSVGYRVKRLVRFRYGPLALGRLRKGRVRKLTDREFGLLKKAVRL